MPVLEINEYSKLIEMIENGDDILLDLYAVWCAPCLSGMPIFEEYSNNPKYSNIKFIKINIDEVSKIAERFDIDHLPTLIRFRNKNIFKKIMGITRDLMDKILS